MVQRRMIITLDDELHQTLKELSEASGIPAARFAAELLKESQSQLKQLTKVFKMAKQKPLDAIDAMEESLAESMRKGTELHIDLIKDRKNISEEKKTSKKKRVRKPKE